MTEDLSTSVETSRRAVLGGLGATVSGFGLGDLFDDSPQVDSDTIVLRQGDRCLPVTPISGDQPVESFYGYYILEQYASDDNGGSSSGSGPPYSSLGTTYLQQPSGSILFLYDGPNGLSLVIVHGSVADSSSGGSVTFAFDGLPDTGSWPVKDDLYRNPDTGEIAASNEDRWNVGDSSQVVDWTWADSRTDGGAFRGLGSEFSVTIDPAFNEEATLYGDYYDGTVESWELLVPEGNGIDRAPLDMTEPVTIETGTCDGGSGGPSTPIVDEIEFRGCGQAWVVFSEPFDGKYPIAVRTSAGWQELAVSASALERIPGQFGERPVLRVRSRVRVLAVRASDRVFRNPNDCAPNDQDADDRDEDEDDSDDEDDDDDEDSEVNRDDDGEDEDDEEDGEDDDDEDEDEDDSDDDEDDDDEDDEEDESDDDDDDEDEEERERGSPPWRDDDERPGNGGQPGRGPPERDDG